MPVKDCDSYDRDKVVRNGEGREEHAHTIRHAVAQQREHAQRKGNVGGHRDCPAIDSPALVKEGINARRNNHATHSSKHGQHSLTRISKLAHRHLVLKLNAYQQKEDSHEEVVNKNLNGKLCRKATETHKEWLLQKVMDGFIGISVGANYRSDSSKNHDGCRDSSVARYAIPQVVALELLALRLVKQLLARLHSIHRRPLSTMPQRRSSALRNKNAARA